MRGSAKGESRFWRVPNAPEADIGKLKFLITIMVIIPKVAMISVARIKIANIHNDSRNNNNISYI